MKKIDIRIYIVLMIISFLIPVSTTISDNSSDNNNETSNVTSSATSNIYSNVSSNVTNIAYQVDVDNDYGFYRVIDRTTRKPINYTNKTLNISIGDTVIWMNDATPDDALTIISEQGLWENRSAYLRWNYQKFSYVFNESGTYTFYVREYKRLQHQTIIVEDIPGSKIIHTPTAIMTVTSEPTTTYASVSIANDTITPTIEKPKETPTFGIATVIIVILTIYLYTKGRK